MDNTKNTALDMHNILFASLEKLSDDDLLKDPEKLEMELKRTKGICEVSEKVMNLASLQLEAAKLKDGNEIRHDDVPRLLCSRRA